MTPSRLHRPRRIQPGPDTTDTDLEMITSLPVQALSIIKSSRIVLNPPLSADLAANQRQAALKQNRAVYRCELRRFFFQLLLLVT